MKVLIVDDRAENRVLLREQLRVLEVEADGAESGARALRKLRKSSFDLVISDLLMPEMDGFQLCYLLKTDPRLKRTPIVIYTANYATRREEQQAKDLGADDFITRPIDDDELAARIQTVFDRSQAGVVAQPSAKPEEGFFREYSALLMQKLEDQLVTAEENARLLTNNAKLREDLEAVNANLVSANEELKRANADLEAFTYSVSHDLRGPVRAIEGMTQLLVEALGDPLSPETKRFVDSIRRNTTRMNALINGLLEHSRMRNVSGSMIRVDTEAAVAMAVDGLEFAIRNADAVVRQEGPFPPVLAHEQPLVQIITNLIDNALKFRRRNVRPEITISARQHDGRVRLTVADNGVGIAPAEMPRLFKIFERLTNATDVPGTGIGLAIVQKGAERMGGFVGVESREGEGSTFWIELRAAE